MSSTGWVWYGFNGPSSGGTQLRALGTSWSTMGVSVGKGKGKGCAVCTCSRRESAKLIITIVCSQEMKNDSNGSHQGGLTVTVPVPVCPCLPVALLSWVGPITAALYCIAEQITQLVLINLN